MPDPQPASPPPATPGQAFRSFEDMLADPHEQFDGRSELLASIAEYAAAPPSSAGIQPREATPGQAAAEAFLVVAGEGAALSEDEWAAWARSSARRPWDAAATAAIRHPAATAERDALAAELQGVHGELRANGIKGDPENHWAPLLIRMLARERDEARAVAASIRQKLENLAAGLELSAQATSPSKKSDIERGCAEAVRGIAREAP